MQIEGAVKSVTGLLVNVDVSDMRSLFMDNLTQNLINLGIYSVGMAFYVIVIWYYYRNLSKRDIFQIGIPKPDSVRPGFFSHIWHFMMFLFKYFLLFPIISFVWFLILASFLIFLSKSQDIGHIFLMSMTIIAASRITAYFNEDLSKDVAKLIPLALLGVFIVDPTYFSTEATIEKFIQVTFMVARILQFLVFIVILEFSLRVLHKIRWVLGYFV